MFVPKNRFGPTTLDPIILVMTERGLVESPHSSFEASSVLGYCGTGDELSEAQASITIPRYGSHPALNAPFLPGKKIQQLLKVLGTINSINVADLSYDINCYLPGSGGYDPVLDLPIAVAFLSSYLQQPVDKHALFVGEVDLTRQIRPPSKAAYLISLARLLAKSRPERIKAVYISDKVCEELRGMRPFGGYPRVGELVQVHGVKDLDCLVRCLWSTVAGEEYPAREVSMGTLIQFPIA